jgi:Ca-activated chloride channel family protein
MPHRSRRVGLLLLDVAVCTVLFLALSVSARAQDTSPILSPPPPADSDADSTHAIRRDVNLVLVPATVTDPYGRLVTGLDQSNFRIFEDGVEQEVVHFASMDVPISVGMVFDMSGSMTDKLDKSKMAVVEFMKTSNPKDEFFLVDFNDHAQLIAPFTDKIEDMQSSMLLTSAHGLTALFDGIYLGLSQMRNARNSRKALLIISDGGDNHSRYSQADVQKFVREADVQIYALGIYDPVGARDSPEEQEGPALLDEITRITGGRTFQVETISELPDTASKISMELRNQYVLGYRPSNSKHDGKYRKVKIKISAPRGLPPLHVDSKYGYYAPAQ